ncbi:lysozyme-like protein 4 isoform X2 [Mesocricetus auratus]|uniref:Lysozyme-like protein 4 isoform X2 n=1 Tax=Mesocricetus auratus TaxID=10036 RepID=A0A1U7R9B2_MESAU|nr:lysozyme-like protein 4 isoform X2 [Mesocricetus auratus]
MGAQGKQCTPKLPPVPLLPLGSPVSLRPWKELRETVRSAGIHSPARVEKMQVCLVLLLVSCLLTPIGASILGRCVVAKRLREGGLDYFEGYSLENWVCLAYFESKFNPSAVYENSEEGYTGFGLFQIRDSEWCDHGRNLCNLSCSALLNPNLKDTIECAKKIVKGKQGMGAWPIWSRNCQLSDTLDRWLDGCDL